MRFVAPNKFGALETCLSYQQSCRRCSLAGLARLRSRIWIRTHATGRRAAKMRKWVAAGRAAASGYALGNALYIS